MYILNLDCIFSAAALSLAHCFSHSLALRQQAYFKLHNKAQCQAISSIIILSHMHLSKLNNSNIRQSRIENQLDQIRNLSWAQVIECCSKGIERVDLWIVWVPGKKGTIWEGGQYPVEISFPAEYPQLGPLIKFQPEFKHVHVYKGGKICLPLIEAEYWRSKTNMSDILQRIMNLIHQEINEYSPANMQIFQLYKKDQQEYRKIVKQQALHYSKKDSKYFQQPGVHINLLGED